MNESQLANNMAAAIDARREIKKMAVSTICELTKKSSCLQTSAFSLIRACHDLGSTTALYYLDIAAHKMAHEGDPQEVDMMKYFHGILRNLRNIDEEPK
jgi:hypothetical protein